MSASVSGHKFEMVGNVDYNDEKTVAQLLRKFETKYKDSTTEHCCVITANGEGYEVHGDRYTVDTSVLGDKLRGSVNEHNHVTGESQYSFSWEDLVSCAQDGSRTAIAYDEKYRYTMIFPDEPIDADVLYEEYQTANELVGNDLIFSPHSIMNGDEQHERIKRTCRNTGIRYKREKISE